MGSEIHFDLGIYIREKWLGADNLLSLNSHGKYKSTPFTLWETSSVIPDRTSTVSIVYCNHHMKT